MRCRNYGGAVEAGARAVETAPERPAATKSACADCPESGTMGDYRRALVTHVAIRQTVEVRSAACDRQALWPTTGRPFRRGFNRQPVSYCIIRSTGTGMRSKISSRICVVSWPCKRLCAVTTRRWASTDWLSCFTSSGSTK